MIIGIENKEDIPQIRDVITKAFGSPNEAALVDELRQDKSWIPGLSIIARDDDGRVIAHALFTRSCIGDTDAVILTPVSVLPEHQNTGAGTAVTQAAIDAARDMGEKYAVVLGHPGYYPRFGFEQASVHHVSCSITKGPREGIMVMSLDGSPIPAGDMSFSVPMTKAIMMYQPE